MSSKDTFKHNMDNLNDVINSKAGTTGNHTIVQMTAIAQNIQPTGTDTSDATLVSSDELLLGVTAYSKGVKYTGTYDIDDYLQSQNVTLSTTAQQIEPVSPFLGLDIVNVPGVACANLTAGNVKSGVVMAITDTSMVMGQSIMSVTGTFTNDATLTYAYNSSTQRYESSQILSGSSAYKDGYKVYGTGTSGGGTDTSDATLASSDELMLGVTAYSKGVKYTGTYDIDDYLESINVTLSTSAQQIEATSPFLGMDVVNVPAVACANLTAGNVKAGVVMAITDSSMVMGQSIMSVTGTYTSDATAAAGDIVTGKSAYVNGSKINGSMAIYDGTVVTS